MRWLVVGLLWAFINSAAQSQDDKVHRVGVLLQNAGAREVIRTVLIPELAAYGLLEGKNLVLEIRAGRSEELPRMAVDLLALNPIALVAVGGRALSAARGATSTTPIIGFGPHPVDLGFAQSFARPGGNVTGIVILASELDAKRLELLLGAVPSARTVAALINPTAPDASSSRREMGDVGAKFGVDLKVFEASGAADYPNAFAGMTASAAGALAITANPGFNRDTALLVKMAAEAGLPTVCQWREMAEQGCFLSYGPSYSGSWRRMARYIALVSRGIPPGELPVEQPTSFELVVNMGTAKRVGVEVPPSLLVRADEVIP
jgi:putative ABC transport system substrate-binding protein